MELIFEVRDADEGGYYARAMGPAIFMEGETWEELRANVLEAVMLHFVGGPMHPRLVQLHYVKDELIAVEARAKVPRGVSGEKAIPENLESRLRLFDRATERHRKRPSARPAARRSERGWSRDDLYGPRQKPAH